MFETRDLVERFWEKVAVTANPDRCWNWQAGTRDGYGYFNVDAKMELAHRTAWFLKYGYWSDFCILHSCDNPSCVNTNHLREGTRADNAEDKVLRGRCASFKGEEHPQAKLTEADVIEIRKLSAEGVSQPRLAKMFHIGNGHVAGIIYRKVWRHV